MSSGIDMEALIRGLQAVMDLLQSATDMAVCVGPPDSIAMGSVTTLIGNIPAARLGDTCEHGGTIVLGCPTVLIG
jgi:uncharacterized Zn-binding protein involved in type VI secretion